MNRVLFSLTARQLLGRRRTALIGLILLLPLLVAVIYRFSDDRTVDDTAEVALGIVGALILTLLLPLVALVMGTAALGAEIEDGTAVFLLTKPVERWRIVLAKIVVASAATLVLVVPVTMITTAIIHDPGADGLMVGLGLTAAAASVLYCAVFVALSTITSRALVIGLIYVFVWEAIVTNLFGALRWLSIREFANGWSDLAVTIADRNVFDPALSSTSSLIASAVVLAGSGLLASYWLGRFEIGERA